MRVSTGLSFSTGDELILMLQALTGNSFQILSSKGKIPVVFNSEKNVNEVVGINRIVAAPVTQGDKNVAISSEPMTLDEFKAYVNHEVLK